MSVMTAADPVTAYPLLAAMAHGEPLKNVSLDITLSVPTFHGRTELTVHPGVIDGDAIELYGFCQCALLAGAVAERTGEPLLAIERYQDSDGWQFTHMAAITDGLALDIHGLRSVPAVLAHMGSYGPWPLRHRLVDSWAELSPCIAPLWTDVDPLMVELTRLFADVLLETVA